MSEQVLIAIVTALSGIAIVLVNTFMAFQMAKLNLKQDAAAVKVDEAAKIVKEVKTDLETTNSTVDKKLTDIHTLVNSKMGKILSLYALSLRRFAVLTGKQEDIDAANQAESDSRDHDGQQNIIDLNKPKETT